MALYDGDTLLPDASHTICVENRVYADYWHSFYERLRNQKAVEWIFMMKWHACDLGGVIYRDVQQLDAIQRQLSWDERTKRLS